MAYTINPIKPVGALVTSFDLHCPTSVESLSHIKADLEHHKILIFKNQSVIDANRQVEISSWFGEVETAGFDQHPQSPVREILRVSNDTSQGFVGFGDKGFHIDGAFLKKPNSVSIYHIIVNPKEGSTLFCSLNQVFESLSEEQKSRWERLWMVKTFKYITGLRDTPGYVVHPLVYPHPVTGQKTLVIHQGKTSCFVFDKGSPEQRKTEKPETQAILKEIDDVIYSDGGKFIYTHHWEPGDFILSDNLAVGHLASPQTQLPPEQTGLRVMHRTVVKGTHAPSK